MWSNGAHVVGSIQFVDRVEYLGPSKLHPDGLPYCRTIVYWKPPKDIWFGSRSFQITAVCFGIRAEIFAKHAKNGDVVCANGHMQPTIGAIRALPRTIPGTFLACSIIEIVRPAISAREADHYLIPVAEVERLLAYEQEANCVSARGEVVTSHEHQAYLPPVKPSDPRHGGFHAQDRRREAATNRRRKVSKNRTPNKGQNAPIRTPHWRPHNAPVEDGLSRRSDPPSMSPHRTRPDPIGD